jgi:hypothetical protein
VTSLQHLTCPCLRALEHPVVASPTALTAVRPRRGGRHDRRRGIPARSAGSYLGSAGRRRYRASTSGTTTRIGPIGVSRTPGRCIRCRSRSPIQTRSRASTSVDVIVCAVSSTSTNIPLDLHGRGFRHPQRRTRPRRRDQDADLAPLNRSSTTATHSSSGRAVSTSRAPDQGGNATSRALAFAQSPASAHPGILAFGAPAVRGAGHRRYRRRRPGRTRHRPRPPGPPTVHGRLGPHPSCRESPSACRTALSRQAW